MSSWMCCNSCFVWPGAERKLAISTCGHVICSVCYQTGNHGKCLICNAECQFSLLSDRSSSEVKALFSDINVVANKHFTDVSKVLMFQARHQKRLLTHYQQRNNKLEDMLVQMKQEMQLMTKKLSEQSIYITKLENSLQQRSAKVSSVPQMSSHTPLRQKSVLQIPFNSPVSLSRHSSMANVAENLLVDSLFRRPNSVPRLSVISPPEDARMGVVPHPPSEQNRRTSHSTRSATVSRFQTAPVTPDFSYSQSSGWKSPIFNASQRHSMSSMAFPPP